MTANAIKLLQEAKKLTPEDRADLAAPLIDSLESPADAVSESAWQVEVSRRTNEIDNGTVVAVPWSQARNIILDDTRGMSRDL